MLPLASKPLLLGLVHLAGMRQGHRSLSWNALQSLAHAQAEGSLPGRASASTPPTPLQSPGPQESSPRPGESGFLLGPQESGRGLGRAASIFLHLLPVLLVFKVQVSGTCPAATSSPLSCLLSLRYLPLRFTDAKKGAEAISVINTEGKSA